MLRLLLLEKIGDLLLDGHVLRNLDELVGGLVFRLVLFLLSIAVVTEATAEITSLATSGLSLLEVLVELVHVSHLPRVLVTRDRPQRIVRYDVLAQGNDIVFSQVSVKFLRYFRHLTELFNKLLPRILSSFSCGHY